MNQKKILKKVLKILKKIFAQKKEKKIGKEKLLFLVRIIRKPNALFLSDA